MIYNQKATRLNNWNYSNNGTYFITICTLNKNNFFGKIIDGQMELSTRGIIAVCCLNEIPNHFANVCVDASCVMPNHVHILFHVETPDLASINIKNKIKTNINKNLIQPKSITINNLNLNLNEKNKTPDLASLQVNRKITMINYSHVNHPEFYSRINQKSKQLIPKIIQQYKSSVTRRINPKTVFFAWQPLYHDIIVKDENQLNTTKNYIINNPSNWQSDKLYN